MSTISVSPETTTQTISISTITVADNEYNPRVHFSDSIDNDLEFDINDDNLREHNQLDEDEDLVDGHHSHHHHHHHRHNRHNYGPSSSNATQSTEPELEHCPEETVHYSSMYLCPQENFKLSRSSPSSPAGSNVSIVGSLASPRKISTAGSAVSWKFRTRYSKRRGQDRPGSDRERQPSVCSDSETDSMSGSMVNENICLSTPTTKKWSLPLPVVTRSSESDSASSSWSARSADEGTEDERSPVPSPSASTHSDYDGDSIGRYHCSGMLTPEHSAKSLKAVELENNKLALKSNRTEEFVYQIQDLIGPDSGDKSHQQHYDTKDFRSSSLATAGSSSRNSITVEGSTSTNSGAATSSSKDKAKSSRSRKKKLSRAAESHHFQRMKTTNYGRCKICDAYVYFWGFECSKCELICHRKCLKKMAIMCPRAPLPPRSSILNLDLESLSADENVPLLVVKCTAEIERRSITRPGIYRMTGVASRVGKLLKSFESGPHLIDLSDVSANDLTSVLKVFLRELKDPLITNDIYKDFIDIGRIYRHEPSLATDGISTGDHSDMIDKLKQAVSKLSPHRYATLRHLINHLNRVASCRDQNSMTSCALGIIFAPTIFRPRDTINDLYTEVFEAAPQARVIELLIRFYLRIFEEEDDAGDLDNGSNQNERRSSANDSKRSSDVQLSGDIDQMSLNSGTLSASSGITTSTTNLINDNVNATICSTLFATMSPSEHHSRQQQHSMCSASSTPKSISQLSPRSPPPPPSSANSQRAYSPNQDNGHSKMSQHRDVRRTSSSNSNRQSTISSPTAKTSPSANNIHHLANKSAFNFD